MFKNKLIVGIVLGGFSLGLVGPALAHEDNDEISVGASSSFRVDLKDLNQIRREEKKMLKEMENDKTEVKQKHKLSKTWRKIEKRISKIIKGQEKLAVKLDDRLDVMASSSINVTELRTKLSTAISLIGASKTALTDAPVKASASIQTQSYDDAKVTLTGLINGLKDKIKASHQALTDVMVGIKVLI